MNSRASKNLAQSKGKSIKKLVVPLKNGYINFQTEDGRYADPNKMNFKKGDFPKSRIG